MWQFAKSGGRLRSPASIEPSFHCEGVLLSARFEPEIALARAAGTEDSRKAKATWQSASADVLSQSKCDSRLLKDSHLVLIARFRRGTICCKQ